MRNTLFLLALCQALGMTVSSMLVSSSGLIGESLSPDPKWATLPVSMQFFFTMLATLPASMLMQRKGRRFGFMLGAVIMMLGACITAYAIYVQSFIGFILGLMVLGSAIAFFQLFRFAAIDVAPPEYTSKAVSWVLLGGLIAAFTGPNLASYTHLINVEYPFLITFLSAVPLALLMMVLLSRMNLPAPSAVEISGQQRPVKEIIKQPVFIVAVVSAMIAYGVMTFLMTATPLAMKGHGFDFGQTAFIIQWHIVGMFAPSFFTGAIIQRIGVLTVMLLGAVAYVGVVMLNFQPQTMLVYWLALVLLGIGWNFMFIGATTLLHDAWRPAEKGKVQGINDTLVFSAATVAAMSSGILYANMGWESMNLFTLPLTAIAASLIIYLMMTRKRSSPLVV